MYKRQAIRDNVNNLDNVKKDVWVTFVHKASSDDHPQQFLCLKGENTWCQSNQRQLKKTEYNHKTVLPLAIIEATKPIYKELFSPELLKSVCMEKLKM